MPTLKNPIIVPIRLDALSVGSNTPKHDALPTADFRLLDTPVGKADIPPPWLGDTVRPNAADSKPLELGVHLHWTLPAPLRHGKTVYVLDDQAINELTQQGVDPSILLLLGSKANPTPLSGQDYPEFLTALSAALSSRPASGWSATYGSGPPQGMPQWTARGVLDVWQPAILRAAVRMKLPPVPNRWLLVRVTTADTTVSTKSWVVESDRLTASDAQVDGSTPGPCTVPAPPPRQGQGHSYQHLGRTSLAPGWSEPGSDPKSTFPLTAVGYGIPHFAAYYPDCRGVFGLYDDMHGVPHGSSSTYFVIGWYSPSADDPFPPSGTTDTGSALLAQLGYTLSPGAEPIDGSIYLGSLGSVAWPPISSLSPAHDLRVALGNTAAEALAKLLADSSTAQLNSLSMEQVLDAAQAAVLHDVDKPDGPARIEQALHERGFETEHGGRLWQVARTPQTKPAAAATKQDPIALPPAVATCLDNLNQAQIAFDRVQAAVLSQRQQLFTDVCRWLLLTTIDEAQAPTGNEAGSDTIVETMADSLNVASGQEAATDADSSGMLPSGNLVPNAVATLVSALKQVDEALAAAKNADARLADCSLVAVPAPRYYRPNDPVVLLSEPAPGTLLTTSPEYVPEIGKLRTPACPAAALPAPLDPAPQGLPALGSTAAGDAIAGPSSELIENLIALGTANTSGPCWRPLLLGWEAHVRPVWAKGSSPSSIADSCQLDDDAVDILAPTPSTTAPNIYNGRVVLSSHAQGTLRAALARIASSADPLKFPDALAGASETLTSAYGSSNAVLSQRLDGFHDRLLMLRRIPQLDVYDRSSTGVLSSNQPSDAVNVIGQQNLASPDPISSYCPIRSGTCHLTDLWLIDAFGQQRTLLDPLHSFASKVVVASPFHPLTTQGSSISPLFTLPPRLCQPSRLLFRWLPGDAKFPVVESNQHRATSPVCGWLMLDHLDESFLFFNADGSYAGSIVLAKDSPATYKLPPGAPAGSTMATIVTNSHVQQVMSYLVKNTNAVTAYGDISSQLLTVEPHAHRNHSALSVLVSRPLALVRAALRLELLGAPSPDQGYGWIKTSNTASGQSMKSPSNITSQLVPGAMPFLPRDTGGFTDVKFPVLLGNSSFDDDGLVLYFPLTTAPDLAYFLPRGGAPAADEFKRLPVQLACSDPNPTEVLLLVDPRAPVHATTGILPVKRIDIPPDLYTDAMRRMKLIFQVGPVLSPSSGIKIPLPAETRAKWQWLPSGQAVPEPISGKVDDRAHPTTKPPVIRHGSLLLVSAEAESGTS